MVRFAGEHGGGQGAGEGARLSILRDVGRAQAVRGRRVLLAGEADSRQRETRRRDTQDQPLGPAALDIQPHLPPAETHLPRVLGNASDGPPRRKRARDLETRLAQTVADDPRTDHNEEVELTWRRSRCARLGRSRRSHPRLETDDSLTEHLTALSI